MNKVTLIGRLTKDPELKQAINSTTAIATFTLAVDRRVKNTDGQKETDLFRVVVWGEQAETITGYVRKGDLVVVSGMLQTRSLVTVSSIADEVKILE